MAAWYDEFFGGLYARVLAGTFDEARSLKDARTVKRLLKLRKGARVLDIPCGMGRLTLPLARMGLIMTGVDLTGRYIKQARRHAKQESLDVGFRQDDMRKVDFDSTFDAAFNWFGSFGYFSDADNLNVCRCMYKAVKPGGQFLVDGA